MLDTVKPARSKNWSHTRAASRHLQLRATPEKRAHAQPLQWRPYEPARSVLPALEGLKMVARDQNGAAN